jgi:hypothetical protein
MGAKFLILGLLIWFGLMTGRIAFPETKDPEWRGALYFSYPPLLVAVSLWHGQFEMVGTSCVWLRLLRGGSQSG